MGRRKRSITTATRYFLPIDNTEKDEEPDYGEKTGGMTLQTALEFIRDPRIGGQWR
jgi:hypothetical protein